MKGVELFFGCVWLTNQTQSSMSMSTNHNEVQKQLLAKCCSKQREPACPIIVTHCHYSNLQAWQIVVDSVESPVNPDYFFNVQTKRPGLQPVTCVNYSDDYGNLVNLNPNFLLLSLLGWCIFARKKIEIIPRPCCSWRMFGIHGCLPEKMAFISMSGIMWLTATCNQIGHRAAEF